MSSNEETGEAGRPIIKVLKDGPYLVKGVKNLRNSKGVFIETTPTMALCRCGGSGIKPFCDGAHEKLGFSGEKEKDRVPDRPDDYAGEKLTVHDNRGVCSHIGHCTDNRPEVFRMKKKPWIEPDGASPEKTARVIRMCPSGALSYTKDGVLYKDYPREHEIFVGHNRSYHVVGYIELKDPDGSKPESKEHYTLCRCGKSKNKPFCDGTHWKIRFEDEKN